MKKVRLRVTSVILLITFVITLTGLAGCAKEEPKVSDAATTANVTEQTTTAAENPFEKTLEFSWSVGVDYDATNHWYVKHLEEKYNVKITIVPWERGEKEQIKIATGDLPDFMTAYNLKLNNMHEEKIIRSIPKDFLVKYAPSYWRQLEQTPPTVKINLVPGKDEYLALLTVSNPNSIGLLPMYRLDWLENVGIKPNGTVEQIDDGGKLFLTNEPFTIEQYEKILYAFRNDDPDKNGKKDTYGLSSAGALSKSNSSNRWLASIAGAFGVLIGNPDLSNIKGPDGKVTDAMISDKYKSFLKMLAKWYKDDLIDPEFPVLTEQAQMDKVTQGIIGTQINNAGYANPNQKANLTRPPVSALNYNEKAKFVYAPPEIGPEGYAGTAAGTMITSASLTLSFIVNSKVSDEVLIRWLRMFEDVQFNMENWVMHYFGKEGTDFEWSGEPYKSPANTKYDPKEPFGQLFLHNYFGAEKDKIRTAPNSLKIYNGFDGEKYNLRPYKMDLFGETKYSELWAKSSGALNTIKDEFFLKAVIGEIDIDAKWDSYVNQYLSSGGQALLDELEKAPKVEELRGK